MGRQHCAKVAQLVVHLLARRGRPGNFLAQQLAIALPKPMHGDSNRSFIHPELRGQGRIGLSLTASDQARMKGGKQVALPTAFMLGPEPFEHRLEQGQSPTPLEALFGRRIVPRLTPIARLGVIQLWYHRERVGPDGNRARQAGPCLTKTLSPKAGERVPV
jgi:hypothetical protein